MTQTYAQKGLTLAEQAAEWVCTLENAGPDEQAGFRGWLKQSSHHVEEFLLACAVYRELDGVDPQHRQDLRMLMALEVGNVVPIQPSEGGVGVRNRMLGRGSWKITGIAATVALIGIAAVIGFWLRAPDSDRYTTSVGEQRIFELSDGSVIYLNAQSRIKAQLSDTTRDIQLLDGEALFKVAHDPSRPFRVHADGAVIQALGTQFNVYRQSSGTTVAVIEGVVRVTPRKEAPTKLTAGAELRLLHEGNSMPITRADITKATAWRQRRLVFKEDRLADVASEFNRYNRSLQIHLEGESVGERKLTGVFDADAPESLIRFLDGAGDYSVQRDDGAVTIRAR